MTKQCESGEYLRGLGFSIYSDEALPTPAPFEKRMTFVQFTGIIEVTFAIDENGIHWVNPTACIDLSIGDFKSRVEDGHMFEVTQHEFRKNN